MSTIIWTSFSPFLSQPRRLLCCFSFLCTVKYLRTLCLPCFLGLILRRQSRDRNPFRNHLHMISIRFRSNRCPISVMHIAKCRKRHRTHHPKTKKTNYFFPVLVHVHSPCFHLLQTSPPRLTIINRKMICFKYVTNMLLDYALIVTNFLKIVKVLK